MNMRELLAWSDTSLDIEEMEHKEEVTLEGIKRDFLVIINHEETPSGSEDGSSQSPGMSLCTFKHHGWLEHLSAKKNSPEDPDIEKPWSVSILCSIIVT